MGIYRQEEEEEEEAGLILGVEAKIVARLSGWAPRAIVGLLPIEQIGHLVYTTWLISPLVL